MANLEEARQFLNRRDAGEYLTQKFGFGSYNTLMKLAVIGGGPPFARAGARVTLYRPEDLDSWALSRISPARASTSEATE
ncbi:DNA-binding protein [Methylocella sp.]|uniref:DNA-binding protein n=1 Tax=Methylocella sp. TaxID=1978226 RepID=UPI0035B4A62D